MMMMMMMMIMMIMHLGGSKLITIITIIMMIMIMMIIIMMVMMVMSFEPPRCSVAIDGPSWNILIFTSVNQTNSWDGRTDVQTHRLERNALQNSSNRRRVIC